MEKRKKKGMLPFLKETFYKSYTKAPLVPSCEECWEMIIGKCWEMIKKELR